MDTSITESLCYTPETALLFANQLCAKSLLSCPTFCDHMDCSPPGLSVHGILQARILVVLPFPPPGYPAAPGIKLQFLKSPALAGIFFTIITTWEARWH